MESCRYRVAVRVGAENRWRNILDPRGFLRVRESMRKTMKGDLISFARQLKKKGNNKLQIVEEMEHLYEYNKLIYKGMASKSFVPISLKKANY